MIISKSVFIIRFGLAIVKSRQAESLMLNPYSGPCLLYTPTFRVVLSSTLDNSTTIKVGVYIKRYRLSYYIHLLLG